MTKGRVAWVFWLLVVLAVLTSTASYAWLSISFSAGTRGIAVSLRSDSKYLQISANYSDGYMEEVSFGSGENDVFDDSLANSIFLVTYGYLPEEGGLKLTPTLITEEKADSLGFADGKYGGVGRIYCQVKSDIAITAYNTAYSYKEITSTLSEGDSVIGLYLVSDLGDFDVASEDEDTPYYYRHSHDTFVDYVCIGTLAVGEKLSGRRYWGYAESDDTSDSQGERMLSIVSLDVPPKEYAYKKTVHLRTAKGSGDLSSLSVDRVKVRGLRDYMTDAMSIMFVAKSDLGGEEVTIFYDHDHINPDVFDGELFEIVLGNRAETITVDVYIFFDGAHDDAFSENGVLSNHSVNISFSVDED